VHTALSKDDNHFIIPAVSVLARRISWSRANLNLLYPALAILLTVFAVAPLAYPGFFQSYTGYAPLYNLIDLHSRVTAFYTWSPMWGRAYDLLRMDGPLGYGLAEILHLVGFSALTSIKAIYALAFIVSGFGMFKLAQRVFANDAAALLASALYVYFPAHIAAVYVRGAFGEAVAWAIFPLAMWCAVALENKTPRTRRDALWTVLAFAALMLAQPGLAILFGIFVRVWLLFVGARPNQTRGFFQSLTFNAILLGLALGVVLQLGSILQQRGLSATDLFVPAFVYPFQLFSASWGTDIPTGSFMENAPYQIGFGALGLTILALALLFRSESRAAGENPTRRLVFFSVVAVAFFLILMTPLAAPVWEFLGLDLLLQYPFQLLAFVGFLLPFAAASIVISDARFQDLPLLAVLVIIPLLAIYPYLAPQYIDLNPTQPALARFNNDELALLDAKIVRPPGTWRHGATVELDLTFQALKQPNHDYTLFMHIVDSNGQTWGTTDEKLQNGTLSTLNMVAGRVYTDTKTVQINLDGPNEGYHLELGLYQNATQQRALTETGADFVRINELQ
jgi:hypothetical protein